MKQAVGSVNRRGSRVWSSSLVLESDPQLSGGTKVALPSFIDSKWRPFGTVAQEHAAVPTGRLAPLEVGVHVARPRLGLGPLQSARPAITLITKKALTMTCPSAKRSIDGSTRRFSVARGWHSTDCVTALMIIS